MQTIAGNIPLHPLQLWQPPFFMRIFEYFWDSVQDLCIITLYWIKSIRCLSIVFVYFAGVTNIKICVAYLDDLSRFALPPPPPPMQLFYNCSWTATAAFAAPTCTVYSTVKKYPPAKKTLTIMLSWWVQQIWQLHTLSIEGEYKNDNWIN